MKKKTLIGLVLIGMTTLSGCGTGAIRLSEKIIALRINPLEKL